MVEQSNPEEAQEPQAMTSRQRADQLMSLLNRDKAINEIFNDSFNNQYMIYGKSPQTWKQYFKLTIPESPDSSQCKALAAKRAHLVQEAMFFHAAAEAQLAALASGEEKEYSAAFAKLVAEYKERGRNLPAAKTLETMAGQGITDIRGAIKNAQIIKNFWKRILEGLSEIRKDLELATWNNSTQVKQELYGGGGNIPSNQPDRGQFGTEVQTAQEDDW